MQFWKFQTCPKTWKIGMHFSFNIPVTMQFQKFCRPARLYNRSNPISAISKYEANYEAIININSSGFFWVQSRIKINEV